MTDIQLYYRDELGNMLPVPDHRYDALGQMIPNEYWEAVKQDTTKHDSSGKTGVDQIPPGVLLLVGQVFTYGEKKYGRDNWKAGTSWHEFYGSALRHIYKFWMGEWVDGESNLPHLAHVIVNCIFLMYYYIHNKGVDDRDVHQ